MGNQISTTTFSNMLGTSARMQIDAANKLREAHSVAATAAPVSTAPLQAPKIVQVGEDTSDQPTVSAPAP